jgi:hypothetical protein
MKQHSTRCERSELPKIDLKEIEKMKKENFRERLEFIDRYAEWVKKCKEIPRFP